MKNNELTIDHSIIAEELFRGGCNCAQSTFCAFCDVMKMDKDAALRISSSFGGGMGRLREVCGALSGILMVCGVLYGYSDVTDPSLKAEHYALVQEVARRFREKHGTIICRELLSGIEVDSSPNPSARTEQFYRIRPCAMIVRSAAAILDEIIAERTQNM